MSLLYDHGAVQWLSTDAATSTYVVNTMTFQPKALRFWHIGIQSASDVVTDAANSRRGMGFATGTADRRCVGSTSVDTSATSDCATITRNDAIAVTVGGDAVTTGLLDLTALAADGFTLTIDDATPTSMTVFWEAWGGTDITVAACVDITVATSGNVNFTVTGFTNGATDQVVFFAGVQSSSAINTGLADASGFCIGAAAGTAAGDNICVGGNADDASTAMDTDGWALDGQCIGMCAVAGAAVLDMRATLTVFGTNLFTLNFAEAAAINRKFIALAIKGGVWKSGSFTIEGQTGSATATISGLTTTAVKGVNLMGRMSAEQAADVAAAEDRIGIGCGTSTSSRRSMGVWDEDATASSVCEINETIQYDQVLCYPTNAGGLATAYDINAVNSDGFEFIVDTNGGVTSEWIGYVMFGSVPTTVAITGTITASVNEGDIVTGGKTLIITLTNNTWIAAGALSFDLQRDEIIAGCDSAQSEATGWDLVPKATQSLGGVVRTSDTVVTITWDAFATYNITATETITVTVPSTALADTSTNVVATPTFNITHIGTAPIKQMMHHYKTMAAA